MSSFIINHISHFGFISKKGSAAEVYLAAWLESLTPVRLRPLATSGSFHRRTGRRNAQMIVECRAVSELEQLSV